MADVKLDRFDISIERLAGHLSAPSLTLGWYPESAAADPARNVVAVQEVQPGLLAETFRVAVGRSLSGHLRAAVLYRGDLSSAALTAAAAALARDLGIALLVVVADGVDQEGVSLAARSHNTLARLTQGHETMVLEPRRWFRSDPVWWNPVGPDFGQTELIARASLVAGEWGATVLLTPAGGEELLTGPQFLASRLRGARAARYLCDGWPGGGVAGLLGEGIARLGPLGRTSFVGALRLSLSRLAEAAREPSTVLSTEAHAAARACTAAWVGQAVAVLAGRDPAAGEATLLREAMVSQRPVLSGPTAPVDCAVPAPPRDAPFLDPDVVALSAALPRVQMYDRRLPTPYQRRRALLLTLVPSALWPYLPDQAPSFPADDWYEPDPGPAVFPRCAGIGLIQRADIAANVGAPVLRRLRRVEAWLEGVDRRAASR